MVRRSTQPSARGYTRTAGVRRVRPTPASLARARNPGRALRRQLEARECAQLECGRACTAHRGLRQGWLSAVSACSTGMDEDGLAARKQGRLLLPSRYASWQRMGGRWWSTRRVPSMPTGAPLIVGLPDLWPSQGNIPCLLRVRGEREGGEAGRLGRRWRVRQFHRHPADRPLPTGLPSAIRCSLSLVRKVHGAYPRSYACRVVVRSCPARRLPEPLSSMQCALGWKADIDIHDIHTRMFLMGTSSSGTYSNTMPN